MGLVLTLFAPTLSFAAIGYSTSASLTECGGNNIKTCTYTGYTVSGTNPVLICGVLTETTNPGAVTMTWNGSSMTELGSQQTSTYGDTQWMDDFYITAPAAGNENLVANTTNAIPSGEGFYAGCATYTGASQSAAVDTNITQHVTSIVSADSISVTSVQNNDWAVAWYWINAGRTPVAGSGTTLRTDALASGEAFLLDSNLAVTPAGSYTLQVTTAAGVDVFAGTAFDLIPAGGTPPATSFLTGYAHWW